MGRPTLPTDMWAIHGASRRSLSRWSEVPGGSPPIGDQPIPYGKVGPPAPLHWCPHCSCEVLLKVERRCIPCLLTCGPMDPCAKIFHHWEKAYLDPRVEMDSREHDMDHAQRPEPGGPIVGLTDPQCGSHRAHFHLPCKHKLRVQVELIIDKVCSCDAHLP